MTLTIELRPHIERDGYHLDRFEAWLGDQLLTVSRSGWHAPARKLLELDHSPETLMRVLHAGRPFDPTIVPQSIGEYARWTIGERERGGLTKLEWRPFQQHSVQDAREDSAGYQPAPDTERASLTRTACKKWHPTSIA